MVWYQTLVKSRSTMGDLDTIFRPALEGTYAYRSRSPRLTWLCDYDGLRVHDEGGVCLHKTVGSVLEW